MALPLMTEPEYQKEYGDMRYLAKVRAIGKSELDQVADFNSRKLQRVLAKSGVFHLSLKMALVRFNNRLNELRSLLKSGSTDAAMKKMESLRKEALWIDNHLYSARKLIRHYYAVCDKIVSEEGRIAGIVGKHVPQYINPALDAKQRAQAAVLERKVHNDLIHVMHVLVALDNLFTKELLHLSGMIRKQVSEVQVNHFNFAGVNSLFDQMNVRFGEVLDKAVEFGDVAGEAEEDLRFRYSVVQKALEERS